MTIGHKTLLIIGFSGQALFASRFLIQWIYTEKHKKSVVPVAFWYFSLGGGLLLLTYAILRNDIVFTIGQLSGLIVYSRNLYFIHKEKKQNKN